MDKFIEKLRRIPSDPFLLQKQAISIDNYTEDPNEKILIVEKLFEDKNPEFRQKLSSTILELVYLIQTTYSNLKTSYKDNEHEILLEIRDATDDIKYTLVKSHIIDKYVRSLPETKRKNVTSLLKKVVDDEETILQEFINPIVKEGQKRDEIKNELSKIGKSSSVIDIIKSKKLIMDYDKSMSKSFDTLKKNASRLRNDYDTVNAIAHLNGEKDEYGMPKYMSYLRSVSTAYRDSEKSVKK